jgi:hypothetical protein
MVNGSAVCVRPGLAGCVLNLSQAGALIEVRHPLAPGAHVQLQISEQQTRTTIRAVVLRSSVRTIAALEGVTYQAALLFDEPYQGSREHDAQRGYFVPAGQVTFENTSGSELPADQARQVSVFDGSAK